MLMKISIKREQNQASLSFAERLRVGELCSGMRKKFRPKVKRKRLQLLLALLITAAMGAWGKQIYISYPAWPSGTTSVSAGNLVLEMEPSDSFENLKSKIEDKSGLNPTYMHLYYNGSECANTEILAQKGITEGSVLTLVYIPPYAVKLKDGTADAGKWTATVGTSTTAKPLPVGGLNPKDAVTLKYGGRLKVKAVNATHDGWNGDLSNIPASLIQDDGRTVIVPDGTTLTGTLNGSSQPYKITIAAGATVTLDNATINGVSNTSYKWAGLNCLGNATIVLKDGTTNTVRGFYMIYPGIHVPEGSTLTITGGKQGNGKLIASSNGYGAGIGGGFDASSDGICGNITITGGDITATGGDFCAGIGGGCNQPCGNISIEGGSVTATGGTGAAGIGGGINCSCGNITITNGVTRVTASNGGAAPYSIGAGNPGTCGTVTIGGVVYWQDNAAVGDGATYLGQATIVYPDPLATPLTIEAVSAGTIVVGINGTLTTGMKYSVNGDTPTLITMTTPIEGLKAGDKVQFYGNGTQTQAYYIQGEVSVTINGSGEGFKTKVYGNIMSLLDEEGFATKTELPNARFVFSRLFMENTTLIDASELLLPAATLTFGCYKQMFQGCTNLTKAPKLPATTLATSCYECMFGGCQLLTAAPKLPAMELVLGCYSGMFIGCTSLTNAYVKAAYTVSVYECEQMFNGCTATDAVLHTTSGNKASWQAKMGTGKTWSNWTVDDDWED